MRPRPEKMIAFGSRRELAPRRSDSGPMPFAAMAVAPRAGYKGAAMRQTIAGLKGRHGES
jgi:hypothetical protein